MKFKKNNRRELSYGILYTYETHKDISNPEVFEFMRAVDKCPDVSEGCLTICEVGDSHWHDEYSFSIGEDFGDIELCFAAAWINSLEFHGLYRGIEMRFSFLPWHGRLVIEAKSEIDADAFVKSVES